MSGQFEKQVDDCNMICPYCEHSYRVEAESYDEDARVEKCDECGMKYHAYQSFEVYHHSAPDCELNDKEHEWTSRKNPLFQHCDVCGACRHTPGSLENATDA